MQVYLTKVDLVVVGQAADDYERLIVDYERRLTRYVRLQVHEVKGEPLQRGINHVQQAEGERVRAALDNLLDRASTLMVCDREGQELTTEQLTEKLLSAGHLVVVIGGAAGLTREIVNAAHARLSFGRITLPHQLARLVFTEQLYRCFRIARGEPYHY